MQCSDAVEIGAKVDLMLPYLSGLLSAFLATCTSHPANASQSCLSQSFVSESSSNSTPRTPCSCPSFDSANWTHFLAADFFTLFQLTELPPGVMGPATAAAISAHSRALAPPTDQKRPTRRDLAFSSSRRSVRVQLQFRSFGLVRNWTLSLRKRKRRPRF